MDKIELAELFLFFRLLYNERVITKKHASMNTQKGIAPIAALIIALLVIGGGAYGIKKAADKKAAKQKESVKAAKEEEKMMPPEDTMMKGAGESMMQSEKAVTYGAQGFTPKTVTIKKGETVVFRNKTGKAASVASDLHPVHTIYPEFDQYKTDQRGKDEFRFSFEKIGTWNYHDHLNAVNVGTIVVTE